MFRYGQTLLKCVVTLLLLFVWALPAWGVVYKWKDDNGRAHFTDDITKIPPKHRPHHTNKKPQLRREIKEPKGKNSKKINPARKLAKKKPLSRQAQEIKNQVEIYQEQENARHHMMRGIFGN
jgi:hypothetical protein